MTDKRECYGGRHGHLEKVGRPTSHKKNKTDLREELLNAVIREWSSPIREKGMRINVAKAKRWPQPGKWERSI